MAPIQNQSERYRAETKTVPQTGCGLQSPAEAANNYPEHLWSVASSVACIEYAYPPQTSAKQGVLFRFAMMNPLQRTPPLRIVILLGWLVSCTFAGRRPWVAGL